MLFECFRHLAPPTAPRPGAPTSAAPNCSFVVPPRSCCGCCRASMSRTFLAGAPSKLPPPPPRATMYSDRSQGCAHRLQDLRWPRSLLRRASSQPSRCTVARSMCSVHAHVLGEPVPDLASDWRPWRSHRPLQDSTWLCAWNVDYYDLVASSAPVHAGRYCLAVCSGVKPRSTCDCGRTPKGLQEE